VRNFYWDGNGNNPHFVRAGVFKDKCLDFFTPLDGFRTILYFWQGNHDFGVFQNPENISEEKFTMLFNRHKK
jgi:hypothetical protein